MSTYNSPSDVAAATLARSSSINNVDAAAAAAFALLPANANLNAGTVNYAVDTGTANAYAVALPQTALSYSDGLQVVFRPINSCTAASTINVDGLGVKTIKLSNGDDTAAGNITVGVPVELRYSSNTGYFYVNGGVGVAGAAGSFGGSATSTADLLTGADIAGDTTIDLTTATGNRVHITGAGWNCTTVTLSRGPRTVIFDGIGTLTHHATTNNLPGAANITTAAGDRAVYESDGTTVYCVDYVRASGFVGDLPTQATHSGKFLTTDATTASWAVLPVNMTYTARSSDTILSAANFAVATRIFLDFTSTFTQTIVAAAGIVAGSFVAFRNSGTGVITINPDSTETVDGAATINIYPGESGYLVCTGAAFYTIGLAPKGARIELARTAASSSATVDFASVITSNFDEYEVRGLNVAPATDNVDLWFRTSTDNGSTYAESVSNYGASTISLLMGGAVTAGGGADTKIVLAAGIGNGTGESVDFVMRIIKPSSATRCHISWTASSMGASGTPPNPYTIIGAAARQLDTDVDAIRFLMSSGNIASGDIVVYGIKK